MIEIKNLTKRYGQIKAVNDISLTIKKGEIEKMQERFSLSSIEENAKRIYIIN